MQISTVFCFAAIFSYLLIWIIFKSPLITFFKDDPGVRKVHQRTIPRIGGLAITAVFLMITFFWGKFPLSLPDLPPHLKKSITFATLAIIPVGMADDLIVIGIKNRTKLIRDPHCHDYHLFLGIRLEQVHFLNGIFHLDGWVYHYQFFGWLG